MERQSTSVILYGFALITVLYFIPSCLAARQLLDFPPQNNTVGEDHEHDDQSKSGVNSGVSDHAGSATGDTPPSGVVNEDHEHDNHSKSGVRGSVSDHADSDTGDTPPSGVVNWPPPPTSYQRNNNAVQKSSSNGNCQVAETVDPYGNKRTTITGCNNNGNEGGQDNVREYFAPPPPEYVGYHYP